MRPPFSLHMHCLNIPVPTTGITCIHRLLVIMVFQKRIAGILEAWGPRSAEVRAKHRHHNVMMIIIVVITIISVNNT